MESNQVLKGVIESLPAKTGSGYADTDLIQLYANDGTPNGKIARSALMSCVKDSLGTLLNQGAADLGTSLAKIPALNSGGTLGSATVANLASVLGANMKTKGSVTSVGDFDLVVENGYYTCNPQSMQHKPNTTSGQASLWVLSEGGTDKLGMQILWDNSDSPVGKVFMRTKYNSSTWQNWVVISTDIPSFYKNYADLASLANGLGVYFKFKGRLDNTNANDCTNTGYWFIGTGGTNFPTTYGMLIVLAQEGGGGWSSAVIQFYIPLSTLELKAIYMRHGHVENGTMQWSSWGSLLPN